MPPLTREYLETTLENHEGAILQLEGDIRDAVGQVDRKIKLGLSRAGDTSCLYRGIFANESEARDAGLFILAATGATADIRSRAAAEFQKTNRDMTTTDSSTGGALVPIEFSSRIKRLVESNGVFPRRAFNMPMTSDQTVFLKQVGEVTVFLLSEGVKSADTQPGWEKVLLQSKEIGTLTFYPRNLAEDSAANVAELVFRSIAFSFARKIDEIAFNGDGSETYFGIQGIINKLITINGVDDGGGIVLGSGNLWSELTITDFEAVQARMPEYPGMEPRWYVSRAFYYKVMTRLLLAAGGVTASEISQQSEKVFLGDPVEIVQVMPRIEGNSQVACLYGDMSLAATFGLRQDMTVDQSTEYRFAERQVTVLGAMRPAISIEDLGDANNAGPMIGLMTQSA